MTILLKRKYGDPLEVLIKDEEQTCKGCRWCKVLDEQLQCTNQRVAEPTATRRCNEYEVRE